MIPDSGWVKLHRKTLEWEWYKDKNVKILFIHLLLTVNHTDKKWKGRMINRGQLITSYHHLSEQTDLSIMQVRTSLDKLKSTHDITVQTNRHFTVITINKYSEYQQSNTPVNRQITDKQQTINRPLTTTKELKNERIKEGGEYITPEELLELSEGLSIQLKDTQRLYDDLKDYCLAKGKSYKDYKAALRSWARKDILEGKIKVINSTQSTDPLVIAARKKQGLE